MFKRVISVGIAMMLVFSNFSGWENLGNLSVLEKIGIKPGVSSVFAAYNGKAYGDTGLYYKALDGVVSITDANEDIRGNIEIPSEIEGLPVTSIGDDAFCECANLAGIKIPDTVKTIGERAFYNCRSLINVNIPSSVREISSGLFEQCKNLENIIIPNSITSINGAAFAYCTSLNNIIIPESVRYIQGDVFEGCTALTSITIPKNVSDINTGLFWGCSNLETVVLENKPKKINVGAFGECTSLKNINIPESVNRIEQNAFWGCTSLESIELPDSVEFMGEKVFYKCTSLKNVKLPSYITYFGSSAFAECSSLESIELPNTLNNISEGCFKDCTKLKNITLPEEVTSIGGSAFKNCIALKNMVLPEKVFWISEYAFEGCTNLSNLVLCEGLETICKAAFRNCKSLEYLDLPNSVSQIAEYAFEGCSNLKDVKFSRGLYISYKMFYECTSLESIDIPKGTMYIESQAFYGCSSLKMVRIPESIRSIDGKAFENCNEELIIYGYSGTAAEFYAKSENIKFKNVSKYISLSSPDIYVTYNGSNINGNLENQAYTGSEIRPSVNVFENDTILIEGLDYTVEYKNNINTGIATMNIVGKGGYNGVKSFTFKIIPRRVVGLQQVGKSDTSIDLVWDKCEEADGYYVVRAEYKGAIYRPVALIEDIEQNSYKDENLQKGKTYYYKVRARKRINGSNNYGKYSTVLEASTLELDINKSDIKVESVKNQIYTGKEVTPDVTIKDGEKILVNGRDYELEYDNNIKIGIANLTIKGKGGYEGSRSTTFKIVPNKVEEVKQTKRTTGTIELSWKSQPGSVKYQVYRATSKNGKYTRVVSTSKTSYSDTGRTSGKIYYYKIRAYKVVNSKYYYGSYSDVFTASTKCKTPSITLSTPKTGAIKISWSEISGADGYQVRRATSSGGSYTLVNTVTPGSATSFTNTRRTKGKTYYYKVRAYKLVDGVKVYSSYSTVKSIKAK